MSEFTDGLLNAQLRADQAKFDIYHHDAMYHAEWQLLRQALDRASAALLKAGDPEADQVVRVLAKGLPDAAAAAERIAEHRRRTQELMDQPAAHWNP